MSEAQDATPQPRRRLGLRFRKGAFTTPGQRREVSETTITPLPTDKERGETDAAETPRAFPINLKANSTNCRRLGLSRKRKDLTKKRLEFAATDTIENKPEPNVKTSEETSSPQINNWRQRQIIELEADIETWRNGFIAAIDDLQTLVTPRIPKRTLLTQLGIPLEMLDYLEED